MKLIFRWVFAQTIIFNRVSHICIVIITRLKTLLQTHWSEKRVSKRTHCKLQFVLTQNETTTKNTPANTYANVCCVGFHTDPYKGVYTTSVLLLRATKMACQILSAWHAIGLPQITTVSYVARLLPYYMTDRSRHTHSHNSAYELFTFTCIGLAHYRCSHLHICVCVVSKRLSNYK